MARAKKNRAELRAYHREYRRRNAENINARVRATRKANPEKDRADRRRFRETRSLKAILRCYGCKRCKPRSQFYGKSALSPLCSECSKKNASRWREVNRQRARATQSRYARCHMARLRVYAREWHQVARRELADSYVRALLSHRKSGGFRKLLVAFPDLIDATRVSVAIKRVLGTTQRKWDQPELDFLVGKLRRVAHGHK